MRHFVLKDCRGTSRTRLVSRNDSPEWDKYQLGFIWGETRNSSHFPSLETTGTRKFHPIKTRHAEHSFKTQPGNS